jgi:hypothetical protein
MTTKAGVREALQRWLSTFRDVDVVPGSEALSRADRELRRLIEKAIKEDTYTKQELEEVKRAWKRLQEEAS